MPDIDDFPWDERDNIIDYVLKNIVILTAMVSNQVFLKPRSTIREVSKVTRFSNEQIDSILVRSFTCPSREFKSQVQKIEFSDVIDEKFKMY